MSHDLHILHLHGNFDFDLYRLRTSSTYLFKCIQVYFIFLDILGNEIYSNENIYVMSWMFKYKEMFTILENVVEIL